MRYIARTGIACLLFLYQPVHAQTLSPQQASAVIGKYCATCHSVKLHTANLALDPSAVAHPESAAESWEKVIRKLRARTMPPPGLPRPDDTTYVSLQNFLEIGLDRAAAAHPFPGKLPLLHRMTRSEYQNAVRDLLGLDALPKEMDISLLLPADNVNSGFDNLADLLFVSPTVMESYLGAAEKISRLAVGDRAFPVMVNIYRMPDEEPQSERMEGLSPGTRGGLAIHSDFPLDAQYDVKVTLTGASSEPQQLEITVDGQRVQMATVGMNHEVRGARRSQATNPDDPGVSNYGKATAPRKPYEFRIPVKAGSRVIGIAFVQHNDLRDEEVLRPLWRSTGSEIAVETATISGPYDATGPGDTTSRRRIFICHPTSAAEEEPCARRILTAMQRRAYRRPTGPGDVENLMPFYAAGHADRGFETGIERALQRLLVSPQFLFRIEKNPADVAPGSVRPVSDVELASRLSFFLWSSIPDDELLDAAEQGKLRQPGVLEREVRRMLADARSATLVTNFAEQWLYLRDLDARKPNELLYPDFDESLRSAFRQETDLFLDSVLRSDNSLLELLSANYTFVNERLAKHYGI
ncbi:MAG TPA: DUF1592 domain-containing protein, partial [Bryobacteraceae bacterium]